MASKKELEQITYFERNVLYDNYYKSFLDKLINNIKIEGKDLPQDAPNDYLIKQLIRYGKIGVLDKKYWLNVSNSGVPNIYGKYSNYVLTAVNGRTFYGNNDNTNIIRFTPTEKSVGAWLDVEINKLIDIDISIYCNLINTRQTTILQANDSNSVMDLKLAYKKQQIGMPVIIDGNKIFENGFKVHNVDVPFIVNELLTAKSNIINNINIALGIVSGIDKKERVQSFDLPLNDAIDSIYIYIDTFNKDCESANIDAKMSLNGSIEELYNNDNNEVVNDEL